MEIKLTHIDNYHSKIENLNGNYIEIDNKTDKEPKGVSPMELLLMGVAGCSSIDIISILKKQKQNFKDLRIKVKGLREKKELPAIFKKIVSITVYETYISHNLLAVSVILGCNLSELGPGDSALNNCIPPIPKRGKIAIANTIIPIPPNQ